ncbi:hypothetical protein JS533_007420 [Bifidobacterium amazonense]|uniref:Head fiber protein n=1 Tax=Bifidobacterium amazonense TaxID=2809027 RepID=A0ABS9VVI0_9BIFI|nr:hypothetical protein [Bifidobacterium amazonense]MCH9276102.1 hypothetical protein [Bifidobacterium amazonense]
MPAPLTQTLVVQEDEDGGLPDVLAIPVRLVKPDGSPLAGGATTIAWDAITGKPATYPVTKAAVTASVKAADATAPTKTSAAAAGETPTKAEFDAVVEQLAELKTAIAAVVAEANETKRQLNALITSMRAAGLAADK